MPVLYESLKDKEDKNGKQNKIKSKRLQAFNLNSSGNVYAEFDGNESLTVSAKNTSGDMNITKEKWRAMRRGLEVTKGVIKGSIGWQRTKVKNIRFNTNGIYLPEYSEYFFQALQGKIDGCENLNTSKVKRMNKMFEKAPYANPDVSKWDVSNVNNMNEMFYMATSANPNVSEWNVSNVNYMIRMFKEATSAKS